MTPTVKKCARMHAAGGANVPALNDLLAPYGIAFGDAVLEGQATIDGEQVFYASGANLVRFPAGGHLHALALGDKAATGARTTPLSPPTWPLFHYIPLNACEENAHHLWQHAVRQ